ncbi:cation transporter, partial [Vibrio diabolicus]
TTHFEIRTLLSEQQVIELVASLGYTANNSAVTDNSVAEEHKAITPDQHQSQTYQSEKGDQARPDEQPAGTAQLQMLIQGMTCASCVASVEKALTNVQGVEKAQVNLAEQSALVFVTEDSDSLHQSILQSVKQA